MTLLAAAVILGSAAVIQGRILNRRGLRGELWAMWVLTVLALVCFVIYEMRPELLQYPMQVMRRVFTPVGDWILGR